MTPARPAMGAVGANAAEREGYSYTSCNVEVGRWVTAYGRAGKWMTDASAALPLFRKGGRQHFVLTQPAWSKQKYRVVAKMLLRYAMLYIAQQVCLARNKSLLDIKGLFWHMRGLYWLLILFDNLRYASVSRSL